MQKHKQWLLQEIGLWRESGIISSDQAREISALYTFEDNEASWGKIIFAALGSIIFGLGIILLFAYNWEAMHRFTKMAVILGGIGLAHGLGFYYSAERSKHKQIGESLHLLGTMLFGAGIWLVAQIYHIDEHFPNAIIVWSMGALAIAWVLPSKIHLVLAMALLCLWHGYEVLSFRSTNESAIWLIAIGVLPLAWRLRSVGILFLSLAALLFIYLISYARFIDYDGSVVAMLFSFSAAYVLLAHIADRSAFSQSTDAIRVIGVSVFAVMLYICTFPDIDELHFKVAFSEIHWLALMYFFIPVAAGAVLAVLLFTKFKNSLVNNIDRAEIGIVIFSFVFSLLTVFVETSFHESTWVIYSALFLAYSVLLIYRGTQYLRWQSAALGSVLLSIYIFARFMGMFESLLLRGFAFLAIGALLFAVGIYYSRQKERLKQQRIHPQELHNDK